MTQNEKIARIRAFIPANASVTDETLSAFLDAAKDEIISWRYGRRLQAAFITDVPAEYENIQCMAVVAGLTLIGGVNETAHSENGISRTFRYSDMVEYIHARVIPLAEVR